MNFESEVRAIFLRKLNERVTNMRPKNVSPQKHEPWNWLEDSPKKRNQRPIWAQLAAGIFAVAIIFGITRCSDRVGESVAEIVRPASPQAGRDGEKAGARFVGIANYPPGSERLAFLATSEGKATGLKGADLTEWESGFMRGYRKLYSESK